MATTKLERVFRLHAEVMCTNSLEDMDIHIIGLLQEIAKGTKYEDCVTEVVEERYERAMKKSNDRYKGHI